MSAYKRIQTPEELKSLKRTELPALADSLRQDIIHYTSLNGGHIGASLCCVDLVVALHWVFDSPKDSFVFDVGHQAYAHKMLTGRRFSFEKIRKEGGPSGFTNRSESEHDVFGAGHASTSVSAALGILEGKKHKGDDSFVIAVIGDGALTGGLSFEGLNNAGELKKNLIVVFNDNAMSIDENIGALKNFFKTRGGAKKYFGILGFDYWGPYDGHDLTKLISVFEKAKKKNRPLLIHLKTEKGHSYAPAVSDKIRFHGCGPFEIDSGKAISDPDASKKYQDIFAEILTELAQKDASVLAITAGMPSGTSLKKFKTVHPKQFYDVGIAEAHAALFGAGLATQGAKPFVCIYSTFLQRAYDQLIHDIGIQNLPVRIVMDRAGLVGDDGATHQGAFDYAYLRCLPNYVVMAPKDEVELAHMLETMRQYNKGPITVRFPRGESFGLTVPKKLHAIEIGKSELLYGDPSGEVLICAIGQPVHDAVKAAKRLEAEADLNVSVVNLRFAKPLDTKTLLDLIPDFQTLVTVEEGVTFGGVGSAILEFLSQNSILKPTKLLGLPDRYLDHASQKKQRETAGIDSRSIFDACVEISTHIFPAHQTRDSQPRLSSVS